MPYNPSEHIHQARIQERILVFAGGFFLAAIAGYVNLVILIELKIPISHMSGAVSRLSFDLAYNYYEDLIVLFTIVFGFFSGAVISGVIIGDAGLKPGRRYGIVLMIEGMLFLFAYYLISKSVRYGISVCAVACGIQNAMASSYYGLILRTTHVTGIITDIGVLTGQFIKYRNVSLWKISLLLTLLFGFFFGGLTGVIIYNLLIIQSLLFPAFACLVSGLIYFIWRQYNRSRFKVLL